jgi:RHS repeat-associated protein
VAIIDPSFGLAFVGKLNSELSSAIFRIPNLSTDLIPLPSGLLDEEIVTRTIQYSYDGLYRLTSAEYDDGNFFNYTYDSVGNRLSETTAFTNTIYTYDAANRMSSVNGLLYTWDENGNLLSDGANTNTYDHATRLVGVTNGIDTYAFAYNGLGDRLQQTVNAVITNYTVDLNNGLTQVLSDGTNAYLYGQGRIGQQGTDWAYHLPDALGSVRQLANSAGMVSYAASYEPYGEALTQGGQGSSAYGFAGEWTDGNNLLYLRSRYYSHKTATFITKDSWPSVFTRPQSLNGWSYTEGNPINRTDPSGHWWWGPGQALFDASELSAQNQNVHVRIQSIWMLGRPEEIHAEYLIPGTNLPVDLLDSITGEMWEIKPWDNRKSAWIDLDPRIAAMDLARETGLLSGIAPNAIPYNWNMAPIEWVPGVMFPPEIYIGRDDTGWFDIYAGQTEPGVITWWKRQRLQPELVPVPIVLPESVVEPEKYTARLAPSARDRSIEQRSFPWPPLASASDGIFLLN